MKGNRPVSVVLPEIMAALLEEQKRTNAVLKAIESGRSKEDARATWFIGLSTGIIVPIIVYYVLFS